MEGGTSRVTRDLFSGYLSLSSHWSRAVVDTLDITEQFFFFFFVILAELLSQEIVYLVYRIEGNAQMSTDGRDRPSGFVYLTDRQL